MTLLAKAAMLASALALGLVAARAAPAETIPLARVAHIHGIAVDPQDPSRLLLATHHGFFAASPDGTATRLSEITADFMGFTPHPTDPDLFYASGHPASGGNLGVVVSADGGRTWEQRAEGVGGPVDFHAMDVSKADPDVIYGTYGGLQVSRDGGRSWGIVAPLPDGLIDLAASSKDAGTLYAATEDGLLASKDGGKSWQPAYWSKQPTSMVEVTADGRVYAFVVGTGLILATEPKFNWTTISEDFGDRALLHLAADPTDADKLYAVTHHGEVLASADGGRTWSPFGSRHTEG
jgi:photosystem II stability/assembly factor-like uncharacterized protein